MYAFYAPRRLRVALAILSLTQVSYSARVSPGARSKAPPTTAPAEAEVKSSTCPTFSTKQLAHRITSDALVEASGLTSSRKNPNVLFSHNDSGNEPLIFAISTTGVDLGSYYLRGARLVDWEDIATGPGPTQNLSYLYVADTGANGKSREYVSVYRLIEPTVTLTQAPLRREIEQVTRFDLIYPDDKSYDVEAFFVDPKNSDFYLVTKPRRGKPLLFRTRTELSENTKNRLEYVMTLSTISGGFILPPLVTGASISRDGQHILIRTYLSGYLWQRAENETLMSALLREPCIVPLALERQGEAIAFSADGHGYFTTSEGHRPWLNYFELQSPPM